MISVSLNRFSTNALVHKDGTWIYVKGEIKPYGNLVYLHNGRIEISKDGYLHGKNTLIFSNLSGKFCPNK